MLYLLVTLLLLILSVNFELFSSKRRNTQMFPLLWLIFVCIAGLRNELGMDTKQYESFYYSVPVISNLTESFFDTTRFRPGFVVFFSICKTIVNNFIFVQFIEAIFVNSVIFVFIKRYSKYPYLSLLLYFIINYFEFNMEIQREAISIGFVLLAYMNYKNKKYIFALLLFGIASTFHISCIMALLYPLLDHVKFNKSWIITAASAIVVIPVIFFSIPNLGLYISILLNSDSDAVIGQYVVQDYSETVTFNAYLLHLIHFCIVAGALYLIKKYQKHNPYAGFVLVYMIFMYMSTITYGFYRVTNYFSIFYILFLSNAIILFCKKYFKSPGLSLMAFLCITMYLTYYHERKILVHEPDYSGMVYERYFPYKSVFE